MPVPRLFLALGTVSGAAVAYFFYNDLRAAFSARFAFPSVYTQEVLKVTVFAIGSVVIRDRCAEIMYALLDYIPERDDKLRHFFLRYAVCPAHWSYPGAEQRFIRVYITHTSADMLI